MQAHSWVPCNGSEKRHRIIFFWLRQTAVIILSHSYLTEAEQLFCLHLASLLIQCPGRLFPTRFERAVWMRGAFTNKVYFLVINPFLELSPAKSVADAASTDTASIYLSIYLSDLLICLWPGGAAKEMSERVAAFPTIFTYAGLPESKA